MPSREEYFTLQTPEDLLGKLEHDYARFDRRPDDAYAAFDFFVTAYHLVEWFIPDEKSARDRANQQQKYVNSVPALKICRDLANGAKHFRRIRGSGDFDVSDTRHEEGDFDPDDFNRSDFLVSTFKLDLQGDVAQMYGTTVDAIDVAEDAIRHWRNELT